MKTKIFFLIALTLVICIPTNLLSQSALDTDDGTIQPCASGHIHNELLESDPVFSRSMMYLNQRITALHAESATRSSAVVYTIPVVVHVMHEGEPLGQGSNISDEQVMSAIEGLNEDFRKEAGTNGDGDGVDVELEFCLASRDPEGNSSIGINRVDGSVITNYAEQGIEASTGTGADEAQVKALSTWPREDYMNIWIVNEIEDNDASGGVQGYAYFPINNPIDGIVVLHNAFGTVGNLKPNTDQNRTITHEVGHYLALYHTFNNTNDCGAESNCDTQGDKVCDTPPTILAVSCTNPACDGTQQVENYMDYTSENCRNMFSEGQKTRMRGALLSDRISLLSSLGCVPVTDLDAGISAILSPVGSICNNYIEPVVMLTNLGGTTLTSVEISYTIDGASGQTYSWTGSLVQGSSTEVSLPGTTSSTGTHTIEISSSLPNGEQDEYEANDSNSGSFSISDGDAVILEISVDYFGAETTWAVVDDLGNTVTTGGPYINNSQGTVFTESICASNGCFTLWMYDVYGDGMGFTNGSYLLNDSEGNELASGGGNFGQEISHDFCIESEETGSAPVANFSIPTNETCTTLDIDFVDLSLEQPDNWLWTFEGASPNTSTQQNPQNITYNSSGSFDVTLTVSNANGSDTYTINDAISVYESISVDLDPEHISCYSADNGSISSSVNGGSSLEYSWNTGEQGSDIDNLSQGTYTLTVTNQGLCETAASVTINEPEPLVLNLNDNDIACNGGLGEASISPQGGTTPYSISWSNGQDGNSINNLAAGDYSVSLIDNQNCSVTEDFSISENASLNVNITSEDITCDGLTDGQASVIVSGGTGNYTYSWSSGQDNTSINNLEEGNYSITITDDAGCEGYEEFTINEPDALEMTIFKTDISCFGMSDGNATATGNGGTGQLNYNWSNGGEGNSISNLSADSYELILTDANECALSEWIDIIEPSQLTTTSETTSMETCEGNDGSGLVNVMGGTPNYSYNWSNGDTEQSVDMLAAGEYSVVVSDANGCSSSSSIIIDYDCELDLPTTNLIVTDCGAHDFILDDFINCEEIPDAEMYQWKFENIAVGVYYEGYSIGNNTTFYLSDVTNIQYGIMISVSIKALIGGSWSDYGETCQIWTNDIMPSTQLSSIDCGSENLVFGDIIETEVITGAEVYEWHFTDTNEFDILIETYSNSLGLLEEYGFMMGTTYFVEVKTQIGSQWSEYGDICPISFDSNDFVESWENDELSFSIYPNPNNGQNIFIDIQNLSIYNSVIKLELYNSTGKLIETFELSNNIDNGMRTEHRFDNVISSGMYFLRFKHGNRNYEQKMIVQ